MGAHDAAVHEVQAPVQLTGRIARPLQRGEHAIEDTGPLPAAEAAVHRAPGAVSLRQVPPRYARRQPPEHAVHHPPVVVVGTPAGWALGWEQRLQPRPLLVAQLMSVHTLSIAALCRQALAGFNSAHSSSFSTIG